jgi:hypothetical protein
MFKGSNPTCFVAGTPVLMADGSSKAIEEVKAGDKVLSKDEASGKIVAKEVVSTKVRTAPSTLVIEVEGGTRVETTPEHPFFVEGVGWTPAGRLAIGNAIVTRAGPSVKIVQIETKEKPATVYNFEVADTHSYFVGDANHSQAKKGANCDWLWVHNSYVPEGGPYFRGGTNLTAGAHEVVMKDGLVQSKKGISTFNHPTNMERFGGANRVVEIPDELQIIQRGQRLDHFEIIPKDPMPMERYQELLQQVKLEPHL